MKSLVDQVQLQRAEEQVAATEMAYHCTRCGRRTAAESKVCSKCAAGNQARRLAERAAAEDLKRARRRQLEAELEHLSERLAASERPPTLVTVQAGPADRVELTALRRVITTMEGRMSEEGKSCSHCGKALRSNNTKGICAVKADCEDRAGRPRGGDAGDESEVGGGEPVRTERKKAKRTSPTSDAMHRFRLVAEGFGLDPDSILQDFCEGWLAKARKGVA